MQAGARLVRRFSPAENIQKLERAVQQAGQPEDYSLDPAKRADFAGFIRKFWPAVQEDHLVPDYAGIRPKLHGPDEPQPDFQLMGPEAHGIAGLVALFGIESPGLTSSLAIGAAVADRLGA